MNFRRRVMDQRHGEDPPGLPRFSVRGQTGGIEGTIAFAFAAVLGCGGAELRSATHDDFRGIQREEARLGSAQAIATDEARPCSVRTEAEKEGCEASAALCAIARDVDDADARGRCDRAMRVCRETQASVARVCRESA